jgi:hypothetical protein
MRTVLMIALLGASMFVKAQTWDEWFRQKKTQKKYLLQQIAELKVYLDYTEKGYAIAGSGLQTIRSIKNGDLTLHQSHFSSLKQVNPAIKSWSRVADIILIQAKIIKQVKDGLPFMKQDGQFTAGEIEYCKVVFERLLNECIKCIDELISVITPNRLQMSDDERIKRIESIYTGMRDQYAFISSFLTEIKLLAVQRQDDKKEIELRGLFLK